MTKWILIILCSYCTLYVFSTTLEKTGLFERAPAGSQFIQDNGKSKLIVFINPRSPQSRTSIEEVKKLGPFPKDFQVKIVFMNQRSDKFWLTGEAWDEAHSIPGVEVLADSRNKEAMLYQVETSGQAFLYNEFHDLIHKGVLLPTKPQPGKDSAPKFIQRWLKKRIQKSIVKA